MSDTGTLLNMIGNPKVYRKGVAAVYSLFLFNHRSVNWPQVNAAILKRWSPAGLNYVKTRAWAIAEGRAK